MPLSRKYGRLDWWEDWIERTYGTSSGEHSPYGSPRRSKVDRYRYRYNLKHRIGLYPNRLATSNLDRPFRSLSLHHYGEARAQDT